MKIQDICVTRRNIRLHKPFKTALRTATEIENIEVVVELESGFFGKGAAAPTWVITGDSAESIEAALMGPIKNVLIGKDVFDFQQLLDNIQTCCIGNTSAKAAIDIALYDAYSKIIGVPLYRLLGGKKSIKTAMTIGVDDPEKMAEEAIKYAKNGFGFLKLKVGTKPELDVSRVCAIRNAVPEGVKLRLDANQAWSPKEAVQIINKIDESCCGVEFVEQPVAAHNLEGMKFVTENVNIPVMADESLFSPRDALKLAGGNYADLFNIKLMKCGGIANAWKIASIAEANGIACMIGSMMESDCSVGAAAHLAAAHPNIVYFDLDAPLWLSEVPKTINYRGENICFRHDLEIG